MKKGFLFCLVILISVTTKSQNADTGNVKTELKKRWSIVEIKNLLKKHITPNHNYYQFVPINDLKYKIQWGNDSIKNVSQCEYFDIYGIRQSFDWENKEYIFIRGGTGSGAWHNIVLPLQRNGQEFIISNPILKDTSQSIIVAEVCCMGDTLLRIIDLKNHLDSYIVDPQINCSSAQIDFCIDSIKLSGKSLTVKWIVPNKIEKPNTAIKKIYNIITRLHGQ